MRPILYLVVPCFNEEDILNTSAKLYLDKLLELEKLNIIHKDSKILFVNDGSNDRTWEIISDLTKNEGHFSALSLSTNSGHQNALLAGLLEAKDKCDICVSIDADLQDDINSINEMIEKYKEGYDIVYGARSSRNTDSFFKRFSAQSYYKLLKILGVNVVYNHADYRLLSKKVLNSLSQYRETNLFLRGIIPQIGYKSTVVYYRRDKRGAGQTHYSFSKMYELAVNGITGFSTKPLELIANLGLIISLLSFVGIIWSICMVFVNKTVPGWASMTCIICFVSGIQLMCLGVIGIYISKIYIETKHRPRFIIDKRINI